MTGQARHNILLRNVLCRCLSGMIALAGLTGLSMAQTPPTFTAPQNSVPMEMLPPLAAKVNVNAFAFFAGAPKAIHSGLVWRIYDANPGAPTTLVAKSTEPTPTFHLSPGKYTIHVAYGFAGESKSITLQTLPVTERFTIAAGALRLRGAVTDNPIDPSQISFSIFVPLPDNSEGRLILDNAKAGDIIRLPEGNYHVVSTFGDDNAIMRTDIKIDSGQLTEATINHRAAKVTLKLVSTPGGEAFAGTRFSVLTPGGDFIREDVIGAFPSMILAEGEYTLIARHGDQTFSRDFTVESGLDRDIEVLTSQVLTSQPGPTQTAPQAAPVEGR